VPIRRGLQGKLFDAGNTLLMIAVSLITLYPLVYVLFASMSAPHYSQV